VTLPVVAPGSAPAGAPGTCTAPAGAVEEDLDPADSPETPWRRAPDRKVTVFLEQQAVSPRYASLVAQAAQIWSRSPCVEATAVARCPADASCVRVTEKRASSDGDDTDGEFSGDDGRFRTGGTLTLFTSLMDRETDNGALATIVHEMGHAFGLVHRRSTTDVMNADTSDTTNPIPDAIDFANILVLYGAPP
jgi:hypothetical protein